MNIFKAKKEIIAHDVDVVSGRPVTTPPRERDSVDIIDGKDVVETSPATIDYQIPGVKPVELTDKEWKEHLTFLIKVAKKAPELKEVQSVNI